MNFLMLLLFFAFLGIAASSVVPVVNHLGEVVTADLVNLPDSCDYHCTRHEAPVCATNGQCMQKFQSTCTMSSYNCRHPHKPFVIVADSKCALSWASRCSLEDLKSR